MATARDEQDISSKKPRRSVLRSLSWKRPNKRSKMDENDQGGFEVSVENSVEVDGGKTSTPVMSDEDNEDESFELDTTASSSKKRKKNGVWKAVKRFFSRKSSKGSKSFTAGDSQSLQNQQQRSLSDPNLLHRSGEKPEVAPMDQIDEGLMETEIHPKKALSHDNLMSELRSKQRKNSKESTSLKHQPTSVAVQPDSVVNWQASSTPTAKQLLPGLQVSHDRIRIAPRDRRAPTRWAVASVRHGLRDMTDGNQIPRSKSVGACTEITLDKPALPGEDTPRVAQQYKMARKQILQSREEMEQVEVDTQEKLQIEKSEGVEQKHEQERLEQEKVEIQKIEEEKIEEEKDKEERLKEKKLEQEKLASEKLKQKKLEQEKLEQEKLEQEKLEQEKLEKEKLEQEKLEQEKLEKEKLKKEKLEQEKLEQEKLEKEKLEQEKLEQEKLEKEKLEKEKLEQKKLEQEKLEKEKLEQEKLEQEKLEKEKLEKEKLEQKKLEQEKLEKEKLAQEKLEQEKLEQEKLEKEKLEQEKRKLEKQEEEKLKQEKFEREELEREKQKQDKLEHEKLEQEKSQQKQLEEERLEQEKLEQEKLEQEKQVDQKKFEEQRLDDEERKQEENENLIRSTAPATIDGSDVVESLLPSSNSEGITPYTMETTEVGINESSLGREKSENSGGAVAAETIGRETALYQNVDVSDSIKPALTAENAFNNEEETSAVQIIEPISDPQSEEPRSMSVSVEDDKKKVQPNETLAAVDQKFSEDVMSSAPLSPLTSPVRSKRLVIETPENVYQKRIMDEVRTKESENTEDYPNVIQRNKSVHSRIRPKSEGIADEDSNGGVAMLTQAFERSRYNTISYGERRKRPEVLPKPKVAAKPTKSQSLERNYRFPVTTKKEPETFVSPKHEDDDVFVVLKEVPEIVEKKKGVISSPTKKPIPKPKPLPKPKVKPAGKPESTTKTSAQGKENIMRTTSAGSESVNNGGVKNTDAGKVQASDEALTDLPSFWARRSVFSPDSKANNSASTSQETKDTTRHAPLIQLKTDNCAVCGSKVYQMEKFKVKDNIVHRSCIKCSVCKRLLSVGNFIMSQNKIYCKPHEPRISVSLPTV